MDNNKFLIMVEIGNFKMVGIDEWVDEKTFRMAVDLVWKKYDGAIVGYGYGKEMLVYSYAKMFEIENKETNNDNESTANLHDIISKLSGKDRIVYFDDKDVREYPVDIKLEKFMEECENDGKLRFNQVFMLPEKYNHLKGKNPCWFEVFEINGDNLGEILVMFCQFVERTAKYMKLDLIIGELYHFDNEQMEDVKHILSEFRYKISADSTHFYKTTEYVK